MTESSAHEPAALDKMLRFNELVDLYGGLLTERQRRLAVKHFQEDLSFGEIAAEEGVTRQAIYDAVRLAQGRLEQFEKRLGFAERQETARVERRQTLDEAINELRAIQDQIMDTVEVDSSQRLESVISRLQAAKEMESQ